MRLAYEEDHLPYCLHYSSSVVISSISSIRNVGQPDGPKPFNPEQTVRLSAQPELVGKSLTHGRSFSRCLALPCQKGLDFVTGGGTRNKTLASALSFSPSLLRYLCSCPTAQLAPFVSFCHSQFFVDFISFYTHLRSFFIHLRSLCAL
jgi:hypothetical protein